MPFEVEMVGNPEHPEIVERIGPASMVGRRACNRTNGSEVEASVSKLPYEDVIGDSELLVGVCREDLATLGGDFSFEVQGADARTDRPVFATSPVRDLDLGPVLQAQAFCPGGGGGRGRHDTDSRTVAVGHI